MGILDNECLRNVKDIIEGQEMSAVWIKGDCYDSSELLEALENEKELQTLKSSYLELVEGLRFYADKDKENIVFYDGWAREHHDKNMTSEHGYTAETTLESHKELILKLEGEEKVKESISKNSDDIECKKCGCTEFLCGHNKRD